MRRRRFLGQTGSWGDNLLCPTDAIDIIGRFGETSPVILRALPEESLGRRILTEGDPSTIR